MKDEDMPKQELIDELVTLRQRIADLELSKSRLRHVEEKLWQSEERFREMVEVLPEALFELDIDGKLTFGNRSAFDYFGYTPEDLANGLNALDMFAPDDRSRVLENIRKRLGGERSGPMEYTARRKDGSLFPCIIHSASIMQQGKPVGIRGVFIDISERKRLEAQLIQSQKMEALGTLAGGIAHDFNNILSAIIGYAELAKIEPNEKSRENSLDDALTACDRAKQLVSQILTFSRQTTQENKPVDMGPIIKEGLRLLKASLPSTIQIRQKIAPQPGIILGNPVQIQQVLMNLCTNAAHAMRDKGGVLEVKLSPVEVESETSSPSFDLHVGSYMKLVVSDTGHGIDSSIVERIFDPFYTTKLVGEGTGLGLSVVYGIVKGLGGIITTQSELDKGSTFNIYFPRVQAQVESRTEDRKELPKGNESILFIDDETDLAKMGRMMLESLGYKVVSCTDSVEALEDFLEHPDRYDLVITDMTMPGMTGLDVANQLLKINPQFPIILCTGYSEIIDEKKAKQMGIRAFLMKPVSMKVLADAVRKALDEQQNT